MGKYNNMARAAKKSIEGFAVYKKWDKLIKAGVVETPLFWPAMKASPPVGRSFVKYGKLHPLKFPEDDLMQTYTKRHENWHLELFEGHRRAIDEDRRTRGYLFVTQWRKYIDGGMAREEAYAKVDSEFRAEEGDKAEREMEALQEQVSSGKHPEFEEWLAEEQKYVDEAYAFHRQAWETERRGAAMAEAAKREAAVKAGTETEDGEAISERKGMSKKERRAMLRLKGLSNQNKPAAAAPDAAAEGGEAAKPPAAEGAPKE
mmetsp:Transcript_2344/g.4661  ORF Transcript_2344/g.4661 Transcript_2344/m.4661 type:complete len:260 (-) Transcript_2344:32-811(-)